MYFTNDADRLHDRLPAHDTSHHANGVSDINLKYMGNRSGGGCHQITVLHTHNLHPFPTPLRGQSG
jgi:hypothetical protein